MLSAHWCAPHTVVFSFHKGHINITVIYTSQKTQCICAHLSVIVWQVYWNTLCFPQLKHILLHGIMSMIMQLYKRSRHDEEKPCCSLLSKITPVPTLLWLWTLPAALTAQVKFMGSIGKLGRSVWCSVSIIVMCHGQEGSLSSERDCSEGDVRLTNFI